MIIFSIHNNHATQGQRARPLHMSSGLRPFSMTDSMISSVHLPTRSSHNAAKDGKGIGSQRSSRALAMLPSFSMSTVSRVSKMKVHSVQVTSFRDLLSLASSQQYLSEAVLVTQGSVVVFQGSVAVSQGSVVVFNGPVVVSQGSVVVSHGSAVVDVGGYVVGCSVLVVSGGVVVRLVVV